MPSDNDTKQFGARSLILSQFNAIQLNGRIKYSRKIRNLNLTLEIFKLIFENKIC